MKLAPRMNTIGLLLMVIVSILTVSVAEADTNAQKVVALYMQSLFAGDVEALESCLGENLRERRSAVLDDPTYANVLISRYDNATYRFLQSQSRKNGTTTVDVEITFKSTEKLTIRFLVNQRYEIIDEIIICVIVF